MNKCACCGKTVKTVYEWEGKQYGISCLADMLGLRQSTLKRLYRLKT